ncbi:MAG: Ig-like domain-containing protein, partial [Gammaproteobacteria bacterium]|nr:Ig-like domain-containing protein [Gammaproteobacteria bacterium]
MKLTQINSILLSLIASLLFVACSSSTNEQGSQLEFSFAQFDVLNETHSRHTRQTLGDTSNITSVKILVNELNDGEKKEITSATLSEELETIAIKIPSNKNLNIRGEAFAGETLLYIGEMNLTALLPGERKQVNLVMYPADENADPIQVDIGIANKVGNGPSYGATFSYSRDYVLFTSDADNLVEGDTNNKRDLFLKNVNTNIITNIHVDENGKPVATSDNTGPTGADISADGRYIVFASNADGIVVADKNGLSDIFLRDTLLNTVKLISKKSNGTPSDKNSYNPSISDDGRFIAFSSDATLVGKEAGVFLFDRINSKLSFLLANAVNPKFSGNGGFLVYVDSSDGNLYRYNTTNKTKLRITSVSTTNDQKLEKAQQTSSTNPSKLTNRDHITQNEFEYVINESGRFVVFVPYQNTEERKSHHVYVFDDTDQSISLVSAEANGDSLPLNDKLSRFLSISQDGRYIAFLFNSTVYVKATTDKQLSPVTHGSYPFISPDGREVGYSDTVTGHLFFLPNPIFSVIAGGESNSGIPTNLSYKISGNDVIISWNAIANTSFYRTYVGTSTDIKNPVSTSISDVTTNELILSFTDITKTQYFVAVSSVNSKGESALSSVLKLPTGDLTPPTVLENTISPTADTVDVDTNTTVSFSFSEAMASGSVNNLSIRLNNGHIDIPATVELVGNNVTLTPKAALMPFHEYEVTISDDVADIANNTLGTEHIWKFTTGFQRNRLASSAHHSCQIRNDDTLWCWGNNAYGQLGNGNTISLSSPTKANNDSDWLTVGVGSSDWNGDYTCAIKKNHTLWCWGDSYYLSEVFSATNIPVQVGEQSDWEIIAAGGDHLCAIKSDKSLWCGGNKKLVGTNEQTWTPVALTSLFTETNTGETINNNGWIAVSAGNGQIDSADGHTCAIRQDSNPADETPEPEGVFCWGDNLDNQVGPSDSQELYYGFPYHALQGNEWRRIDAGSINSCAVNLIGDAFCWGSNQSGQLSVDPIGLTATATPQQIPGSEWNDISFSHDASNNNGHYEFHGCASKQDGSIWCWGANSFGQLGQDTLEINYTPQQEHSLKQDWYSVTSGGFFTCAMDSSSETWCWGNTEYGNLGNGESQGSAIPRQEAQKATNWDTVTTANSHSCAVKDDGSLWCWGDNYRGKLGIGSDTIINETSPVQLMPENNWVSVSNGSSHSCAIDSVNKLWCWGSNSNTRLGLGTDTADKFVPTEVSPGTEWNSVAAGEAHTCAIRLGAEDSRELYCWGYNWYGQLGKGDSGYLT